MSIDNVQGNDQTFFSDVDAIIDTGTTLIIGTPSQVSSLSSSLGGKTAPSDLGEGYYTCKFGFGYIRWLPLTPCSPMQFFPDHQPYLWRHNIPNLRFGPQPWTGFDRFV